MRVFKLLRIRDKCDIDGDDEIRGIQRTGISVAIFYDVIPHRLIYQKVFRDRVENSKSNDPSTGLLSVSFPGHSSAGGEARAGRDEYGVLCTEVDRLIPILR